MKEFMLFIKTDDNPVEKMSPNELQKHIEKVVDYMGNLVKQGRLKSGQPLQMRGVVVSGKNGALKEGPFNESKEVITGYYHLLARDFEEAIEIAKADPRFDEDGWKIEIRQILRLEEIS